MSYQLNLDFSTPEEKAERQARIKEANENLEKAFGKGERWYKIKDAVPFRLLHKAENFYYSCRWNIKCAYQKIRYGVSDDDVFSLYHRIAKFIVPRLKYFKETGRKGIPVEFLSPDYHLLNEQEMEIAEKKANDEWAAILDEMIFAFEYIIDDEKHAPFPDILLKRWDKNEFNHPRTTEEEQAWKEYISLSEKLEERKKKGLELFHKHYENLWI